MPAWPAALIGLRSGPNFRLHDLLARLAPYYRKEPKRPGFAVNTHYVGHGDIVYRTSLRRRPTLHSPIQCPFLPPATAELLVLIVSSMYP